MIAADLGGVKANNLLTHAVTLCFDNLIRRRRKSLSYTRRPNIYSLSVRKKTVRRSFHVLNSPRITRLRGKT